jgi:TonB family protein
LSGGASARAAEAAQQESGSDYKRYLTTERLPEYPEKARRERLTGSGLVGLEINTGKGEVTSVRMLKSTGHQVLDAAALKACRRFGFVPGTIATAEVPVSFSTSGAWFPAYRDVASPVALYTPMDIPSYLAVQNWKGDGLAVAQIESSSGLVTSAQMQTGTGNQVLDNIALRNIRQWRFKPGTVSQCKISIRFRNGGASGKLVWTKS